MPKKLKMLSLAAAVLGALTVSAGAMHIAEGYLPRGWCVIWYAACVPFVVAGFCSIKKKIELSPKSLTLLAMCGAFAFVLSALKLPSVTGSCSHPTGVGLGAILFGPTATTVLGLIVLLFQAILLAHGGITTLGANVFSMAIVGPFVSFFVYRFGKKCGMKTGIAVFLAAFSGDLLTYVTTSFQLAAAFPGTLLRFLAVFAVTQLPLAIAEGLLTVIVFNVLTEHAKNELRDLRVL